ncbi:MAG: hypothetical protein IT319_01155 [Anaerolineae bacterium]|nr:hypothetical protein [Anaerolineae bacterium]
MLRRFNWWIIVAAAVLLALILVIFVHDAQAPPAPAALPLTRSFDDSPQGFTLMYPAEWEVQIPAQGMAIWGPPDTLYNGVPGPTFTVQRAEPLSVVGTLDAAVERYLQSGPLRTPDRWHVIETTETELEGREARRIIIEGSDSDAAPEMQARVIVTTSDNTFVYFFVTAVPLDKREQYDPTFDEMLATVRILE